VTPGDPAGVAHLYVHLPFCAARCGYCAFVVEVGREDARDAYLQAVRTEIRRADHLRGPLESVYLGGGTPTLMGAGRLQVLLDEIRPRCAPGAEVTVEANPETVDAAMVAALADAGATRVSLGAQSPGTTCSRRSIAGAGPIRCAARSTPCARMDACVSQWT